MKIGSPEWKETIVEGARKLGIHVQSGQVDQFATHASTLIEWNQKINLTAIDSPMDMAIKHFLDSIIPFSHITPGSRLLDVGSGAGFPGIPLKVMLPSLNVTLVDATRKKVSFLNHVIQQLRLSDITAIHSRVENLQQEREGEFDIIVCRAFSSLTDFVEKSLPLLAPEGLLLAFKGKNIEPDLSQMSTLQQVHKTFPVSGNDPDKKLQMKFRHFNLPFLDLSRSLILLHR
jgi:16S rRNA (guanine527-N7)-methyltransferase